MKSNLDRTIDQFATRDLSPAEARELAHQALEDPDLFDALVARGAVEASLEAPAVQAAVSSPVPRKRWVIALCAVAASAVLLTLFLWRSSSQQTQQPETQARTIVAKPVVAPTVLLTSDLQPALAHSRDVPIFRGDNSATRTPRIDGTIVSLEGGVATVNLGSIDGLTKGLELPVTRDRTIGRIVISTVFRERARGKLVGSGSIRINDPVRVPAPVHLAAVLQQVNALSARGNLKAARDVARTALATGSSGETRQLLERLAALDYQAGAPDAASERYEVAVNNFDQTPAASVTERSETLASYGALLLLRGDRQRAEDHLQKALAKAADPEVRSEVLNNLGAIAELRGDSAQAADYYSQALAQKISRPDRTIVQTNLARVNSTKHP